MLSLIDELCARNLAFVSLRRKATALDQYEDTFQTSMSTLLPILVGCPHLPRLLWRMPGYHSPQLALFLGTSSISLRGKATAGSTGFISGCFLRPTTDIKKHAMMPEVNDPVIMSRSHRGW